MSAAQTITDRELGNHPLADAVTAGIAEQQGEPCDKWKHDPDFPRELTPAEAAEALAHHSMEATRGR